jgi:C-terminal processing protease CtpA/Prc
MSFKRLVFIIVLVIFSILPGFSQMSEIVSPEDVKVNRKRGISMLDNIKEVIKLYYYDKTFHGIDIDDKFLQATEKVKTLNTNSQIFRVIAAVVLELHDSHTVFYPPARSSTVEYGFTMQMFGNKCLVTDVKKGSDAETKGLKTGDVISGIGRYNVNRNNLWELQYNLYSLDPQPRLRIFVLNPDNTERELILQASFKTLVERSKEIEKRRKEKAEDPYRCQKIDSEVIACKLKTFSVDKKYIDSMMSEASHYKKFILDLRGNHGGLVKIEQYLTGHFFDREVKIGTFVSRKKSEDRFAKPNKERAFTGELSVLIDSNSASAAEVLPRVIQLEKRGKVIGDTSAGAVMTSWGISMLNRRGWGTFSGYGLNLTIADLIMSDGKRLEKTGVIPDELILPSGRELAERSDPALAYAAKLFGAQLTPQEAGKFFFITKKPENEEKDDDDDDDGEGGGNANN